MTLALFATLLLTADATAYTPGDPVPESERVRDVFFSTGEKQRVQMPQLFVLGWSKDGKLAYVVVDDTGASHDRRYHFVLTDLRTDKQVSSADATVPRENPPTVVEALAKEPAFLGSLNANHVVPDPDADLSWAPVKAGNSTVTVSVEKTPAAEPDEFGRTHVARWALIAQSGKGKKKVFEAKRDGADAPLQVGFLGYLRSPHEPRIAILLGEEHPGLEGVLVVELRVIGATLTTGFRK
jgi:hypothetical protein